MVFLLLCIFVSLSLSDVPFIIDMQNKQYYYKVVNEYNGINPQIKENYSQKQQIKENMSNSYSLLQYSPVKEGMTDISANNIIYDIINDKGNPTTPFQQLLAIRQIAQMGSYSKTSMQNITEILDSSGNSDNTKITNLNKFINTYVNPRDSK